MATKISKVPKQELIDTARQLESALSIVRDFSDRIGHFVPDYVSGLERLRKVCSDELGRRVLDREDF